ncbi:sensor histidine kinase [Propionibacteriaceae bacterium G57]|uniref:sensor histidine kinase n=1 Tax=Aestuariimicrobium sp. G57 TaxID=3418485 RepID=UPI003DA738A2
MPDRPERSRATIRSRIITVVILLTAFALAVSGFTLFALQQSQAVSRVDSYLTRVEQELKILAQTGIDPATGERFTGPSEVLRTFLERNVLGPAEGQVAVVEGQVRWVSREGVPLRPEDDAELMDALLPLAGREVVSRGRLQTGRGTFAYLVVPVRFTGVNQQTASEGALIHVHDLSQEQQQIDQMLRQYAAVALGALALVSVLIWLFVGRLLRPIEQLRKTTTAIGEDDLTTRIPVLTRDDLGGLTASINGMLDRVQRSVDGQRKLLDDVGHELRTPITIVRGHLELVDAADPDDVASTRSLALDELDRMGQLVDDLLLLARADRPDFIQPGWTDLAMLLDSTFEKARALGARTWRIEGMAPGEFWLDQVRITQAWLQLAANAVKYSEPGSAIGLGTAVTRGELRLWVHDEGVGIAADELDLVRQRFARGSGAARRAEGVGLGLSIVESIAAGHHGQLRIDSTEGVGSTFTIALPAGAGPAQSDDEEPDDEEPGDEEPGDEDPGDAGPDEERTHEHDPDHRGRGADRELHREGADGRRVHQPFHNLWPGGRRPRGARKL